MNLKQFVKDTLKNGGATFNIVNGTYNPNKGYMVALQGHELQVPISQFNQKVLADYITDKSDTLLSGQITNNYLGSWVHEGIVYLDCSTLIDNLDIAIDIAKSSDQLAIWSNKDKESILI